MDRISKLAGLFLASALTGLCLASGCGKDETAKPEPVPPDPPKPVESLIEAFKKTTAPGAYDLSGNELKPIVSYVEGENQYSFYTESGKIWSGVTDLDKGVAFRSGVPAEMAADNSCTILVISAGADALSKMNGNNVTCVKAAAALYWVVDDEKGTGIILARKEL